MIMGVGHGLFAVVAANGKATACRPTIQCSIVRMDSVVAFGWLRRDSLVRDSRIDAFCDRGRRWFCTDVVIAFGGIRRREIAHGNSFTMFGGVRSGSRLMLQLAGYAARQVTRGLLGVFRKALHCRVACSWIRPGSFFGMARIGASHHDFNGSRLSPERGGRRLHLHLCDWRRFGRVFGALRIPCDEGRLLSGLAVSADDSDAELEIRLCLGSSVELLVDRHIGGIKKHVRSGRVGESLDYDFGILNNVQECSNLNSQRHCTESSLWRKGAWRVVRVVVENKSRTTCTRGVKRQLTCFSRVLGTISRRGILTRRVAPSKKILRVTGASRLAMG